MSSLEQSSKRVCVRVASPEERREIEACLPYARRAKLIAAGNPPDGDEAFTEEVSSILKDMDVPMSAILAINDHALASFFAKYFKVAGVLAGRRKRTFWEEFIDWDNLVRQVRFLFFYAACLATFALVVWAFETAPAISTYVLIGMVALVLIIVFRRWLVRFPLVIIRTVRRMFRRIEEATRP